MADPIINFSPGPGVVARPVIEQAAQALLGVSELRGLSIVEISHRLPFFEKIVADTKARLAKLLAIPDTHDVLFLQGGARTQFAQIPLNWLVPGKSAAYVETGVWSEGAIEEARASVGGGSVNVIASGRASNYTELPSLAGITLPADTAYVHTTSNNTIYGTQWHPMPDFVREERTALAPGDFVRAGGERVPHLSDMSSDILSRPLDVSRFAMIYAGAQKNAGISGVTLIIIDKAFMEAARRDIPSIWQYRVMAANDSLYNTPPTFAIYCTNLVCQWLEGEGGVEAIAARNRRKASALYGAIDGSDGFYRANIQTRAHRSEMNVTFRLPTPELDTRFVAEGEEAGLHHMKGHRKAGGIRVSLYNAVPESGVERLIAFMGRFARAHHAHHAGR